MSVLAFGCAVFAAGFYGVLTRRDVIGVLASVEVLLGGPLVMLTYAAQGSAEVEGVVLLLVVVAAAEAAVGLALLVAVARRSRRTRIDELTEVRG